VPFLNSKYSSLVLDNEKEVQRLGPKIKTGPTPIPPPIFTEDDN